MEIYQKNSIILKITDTIERKSVTPINFSLNTPLNMPWVAFYLVAGLIFAILFVVVLAVKFPKTELTAGEKVEGLTIIFELFKSKSLWEITGDDWS